MKNSFSNKQTNLDLNGPYLSFDTQPQSVTGIGTKIGGTTGATVSLVGISTVGFSTETTIFNPPCMSVIDENDGYNVDSQWIGFTSAHPARQFNLMKVPSGYAGLGTPSSNLPGVAEYFRMYDVARDDGIISSRSDWFELAGFQNLPSGSLVSLWIDTSGSMTMSSVSASYNLFIEKCNSAGITVETTTGYGENYIGAFITELSGLTPPANKGSIKFQWYEEGVGKLSDDSRTTGTATTTLTISNLVTPTDNGRKFFLEADYDPQTAVSIGSSTITGNAPNEPFNSEIATVTVTPLIEITSQPGITSTFPNVPAVISVGATLSDSSFDNDLTFQWQLDGDNVSDGTKTKTTSSGIAVTTTISGATTSSLTLTSDNSGIGYTANCIISSVTASNSPIKSNEVDYTVNSLAEVNNLRIEAISPDSTTADVSEVGLSSDVGYTFNATTTSVVGVNTFAYSIYSPDKDMTVEVDLFGGKGDSFGSNSGGEGGFSTIQFTMNQNEEYVITGLTAPINTPFIFRKAQLIACVGQGGAAGELADGGDGGGINVGGQDGFGNGGTAGGFVSAGTLSSNGTFGSLYQSPILYPGDSQNSGASGGRTVSCPAGTYWRQQGVSACSDVGSSVKFRLSNGNEVTNTATIERGYKAGYSIIQTAGERANIKGGNGGNGCEGGDGGGFRGGGGGGSGYTDGSVTLVSTRLGGSTTDAKVVIRVVN